MKSTMQDKAVLMRLSISLPGETRKDNAMTTQVLAEKVMAKDAGRWMKDLYPKEALESIKKLDNEARAYHAAVTLPWDAGTGILPAALITEYAGRMATFRQQRQHLVESHFLAQFDKWVDWARTAHNGTFDESLYDKDEAAEKFGFRFEPIPVPGSEHFAETLKTLLGVDTETVDRRVGDAFQEAQRELMRRLIAPVKAMADKLKTDGIFRDSLVGNVQEIVNLAPKLNIAGDAQIDAFVIEMKAALTGLVPETLRTDSKVRQETATKAADLFAKLSGYKL